MSVAVLILCIAWGGCALILLAVLLPDYVALRADRRQHAEYRQQAAIAEAEFAAARGDRMRRLLELANDQVEISRQRHPCSHLVDTYLLDDAGAIIGRECIACGRMIRVAEPSLRARRECHR